MSIETLICCSVIFSGAIIMFISMVKAKGIIQAAMFVPEQRRQKIRNEDTDDDPPESWKSIEEYISEKSDVDFSHGLCPDCLKQEMEIVNKATVRT